MSEASQETVDDILREWRDMVFASKSPAVHSLNHGTVMRNLDRIEAALKRERAAFDCECAGIAELAAKEEAARHKPGNAAAMREALNKIGNAAAWIAENCNDQQTAKYMNDIIAIVQTTIAAPPRQCDVGTAEEQTTRYRKFCSAHKYLGSDFSYTCKGFGKGRCPFFNSHTKSKCEFEWAQTPYAEEGGAK